MPSHTTIGKASHDGCRNAPSSASAPRPSRRGMPSAMRHSAFQTQTRRRSPCCLQLRAGLQTSSTMFARWTLLTCHSPDARRVAPAAHCLLAAAQLANADAASALQFIWGQLRAAQSTKARTLRAGRLYGEPLVGAGVAGQPAGACAMPELRTVGEDARASWMQVRLESALAAACSAELQGLRLGCRSQAPHGGMRTG